LLSRTQSSHGQDTTLGKFINRYNYARPGDETLGYGGYAGPSDTTNTIGSASVEAGRGAFGSLNPFSGLQQRTQLGTGGRSHEQYTAPSFFGPPPTAPPPQAPPPTPRIQDRRTGAGLFQESAFSDLQTSDQTYGNTDDLLQRHHRRESTQTLWPSPYYDQQERDHAYHGMANQRAPAARPRTPGLIDRQFEYYDKENVSPVSDRPSLSQASLSRSPYSFSDARSRPTMIERDVSLALPRSSSIYETENNNANDDDDWQSTRYSASHPNLHGGRDALDEARSARPSQDSYANTSITGSTNCLSMPNEEPVPAVPDFLRHQWGSGGRLFPSRDPDMEEAREILKREIKEKFKAKTPALMAIPDRTRSQSTRDMKRLEEIRQRNPAAVQRVIDTYPLPKQNAPKFNTPQQASTPQEDFPASASRTNLWQSTKCMFGRSRAESAATSDRQGLLDNPPFTHPELGAGRLEFSDSTNTFSTVRHHPPPPRLNLATHAQSPRSMLSPITPPSHAHLRDRADTASTFAASRFNRNESPYLDDIEMQPIHRPKNTPRAGITSQRALRPLTLAASPASALSRPLTDAQLARLEPSWTIGPTTVAENPLAPGTGSARGFGIQQADGTIEHVSLLMSADEARNIGNRRLQKKLSRPWLWSCGLFPVTAAMFGSGAFDFKMREMTGGVVSEMDPELKKEALRVWLPLGTILYVVVGLVVAMLVVALTR
jgi:hypothetical protein